MNREYIQKLQQILSQKKYNNSYAKVSTRQLNIFTTIKERKKYINYLITYATEHSNLSFIKGVEYKEQKTFSYNLNNGMINIPKYLIFEENFINYIPFILSLVEFNNIYYHNEKNKTEEFFNQILFNNIKKMFKIEENFLDNKTQFNLNDIHIDYIEKNAIEFLIKQTKERPIKVETPNIKQSYICKNLFMFQNKGIFVIKNNLCLDN